MFAPVYQIAEPEDYLFALDPPWAASFGSAVARGIEENTFAGTQLKEAQTPPLANRFRGMVGLAPIFTPETPEETAARGEHQYTTDTELKQEFPDVQMEAGMTRARAAALQEQKNISKIRDFWLQKRPWTALVGGILGQATGVENYIPIFGEWEAPAALLGRRLGGLVRGAADATANTALVESALYQQRKALGFDTSPGQILRDMGTAALIGSFAGLAFPGKVRETPSYTPTNRAPPGGGGTVENQVLGNVALNDMANSVLLDEVPHLGPNGKAAIEEYYIKAYHGSPHDFDRFSWDKIGTGEGAQSYSHGLYVAEARAVGADYRDAIARSHLDMNQPEVRLAHKAWVDANNDSAAAIAHLESIKAAAPDPAFIQQGIDVLKKRPLEGFLYEVGIKAKPEEFLDHDKLLGDQTPEVKTKLAAAAGDLPKGGLFTDSFKRFQLQSLKRFMTDQTNVKMTGGDLMKSLETVLGSPEKAAVFMREHGFPGIKYFDAVSRKLAEGTRNYVVFDENLMKILKKNDQPVNYYTPEPAKIVPDTQHVEAAKTVKGVVEQKYHDGLLAYAKSQGMDIEAGTTGLEKEVADVLKSSEGVKDVAKLTDEIAAARAGYEKEKLIEQILHIARRC